jgi:hypothetical protein
MAAQQRQPKGHDAMKRAKIETVPGHLRLEDVRELIRDVAGDDPGLLRRKSSPSNMNSGRSRCSMAGLSRQPKRRRVAP